MNPVDEKLYLYNACTATILFYNKKNIEKDANFMATRQSLAIETRVLYLLRQPGNEVKSEHVIYNDFLNM